MGSVIVGGLIGLALVVLAVGPRNIRDMFR